MKTLIAALTVVTLTAAPALVHTALALATLIVIPSLIGSASAAPPMDAARERAIHECNVAASKYRQSTWGDTEIHTYRTCMNEHGQQE
jgi:hypothetical protein